MTLVAAVPLKRLIEAKSRLAEVLDQSERAALMERMLLTTIEAIRLSGVVEQIALVSEERGLAERVGLVPLPDAASLNEALENSVAWSLRLGSEGLLIVPSDLPFVSHEDVRSVVARRPDHNGVVVAPTEDGGTGALALWPPDAIPPAFGPESARRHEWLAVQHRWPLARVETPGLAFDLDTPEDLLRYRSSAKK